MTYNPTLSRTETGSILFLILLAVVLFAALSYAVTSSMRGGGRDGSEEGAQALASDITQYGTTVSNELARFLLTRSYTIHDIDMRSLYENSYFTNSSGNGSACTSSVCDLFHPNGGGVIPRRLPEQAADPAATLVLNNINESTNGEPDMTIAVINSPGAGTSLSDLAIVFAGVTSQVCRQFNIVNGVHGKGDNDLQLQANYSTHYRRFSECSNDFSCAPSGLLSEDTRINGKYSYCDMQHGLGATAGSVIYMVIHAR